MTKGWLAPALTCNFSGADDGIRTRDPHLGKVAGPGLLTCVDILIWLATWAFSFACNGVVSRRCAVAHGTPTGPLMSPNPCRRST
jgi:hypothetical protein